LKGVKKREEEIQKAREQVQQWDKWNREDRTKITKERNELTKDKSERERQLREIDGGKHALWTEQTKLKKDQAAYFDQMTTLRVERAAFERLHTAVDLQATQERAAAQERQQAALATERAALDQARAAFERERLAWRAKTADTDHATLHIAPTAPAYVIDAAYRALCRHEHPDVSRAPDATARMQRINAAYERLNQRARA
jgi:hypothetical protein